MNSTTMTAGLVLLGSAFMASAGAAAAKVPFFNATCPGNIEVHADEGGPVYINGNETKLKAFNDGYYEASAGGTTISVSVNPDGTPSVTYTAHGGANGICQIADNTITEPGTCPADVSEADRYKYPACN